MGDATMTSLEWLITVLKYRLQDHSEEGRWQGTGVGLGICGIGYHESLADKGVRKGATCDNHEICNRETNI